MIRADELDAFVFNEVKAVLLRPELLLTGEEAVRGRGTVTDNELLDTQLQRLGRQIEEAGAERRRLADLYQANLITLVEVNHRAAEIASRRARLEAEQAELSARHRELASKNQLKKRLANFAARIADGFEQLDFDQRQRLMRLVIDRVRVSGWQVEIHLRVPLDSEPPDSGSGPPRKPKSPTPQRRSRQLPQPSEKVSSRDGLRLARHRPRVRVYAYPHPGVDPL